MPSSAPATGVLAGLSHELADAVEQAGRSVVAIHARRRIPFEVLTLLAAGQGNKGIAAGLGISEHTVKTHLNSIYAKLGVSNRAEAVARGVRAGLLML